MTFGPEAMDTAAEQAGHELSELLAGEATAQDLIGWFYQWHMTAGYKRLGRLLVTIAKEKEG